MVFEFNILASTGCIIVIFWTLTFSLGLIANNLRVRVNYTRKVVHFSMFIVPSLVFIIFNITEKRDRISISVYATILFFLSVSSPLRKRFHIFRLMFYSIDRPEDRPYTLIWLISQTLTGLLVLFATYLIWQIVEVPIELIYLTILATTFGDGLAEPVGIKFGKRKYKVKGLFTERFYQRSIEGSITVFLISAISCFLFIDFFSIKKFILLLLTFPISIALTEAISPHTWDTPFIFLVGNCVLTGVYLL